MYEWSPIYLLRAVLHLARTFDIIEVDVYNSSDAARASL